MKLKNIFSLLSFVLASSTLALVSGYSFANTVISASAAVEGMAGANGLTGKYWHLAAESTNNIGVANSISTNNSSTPTGTFISSSVNYSGFDLSTIKQFLGADASSYQGSNNDMSDGIIETKGYIKISASTITFSLNRDDTSQLKIGGQTLISNNCCGLESATATFSKSGFYAIDVLYSNRYNRNGGGLAFVTLKADGNVINDNLYQNVTAVPEPGTYATLLAGLGLMGFMVRRRKTS